MIKLRSDNVKIKAPRVQIVADDVSKILSDLYNFICDAEQIVVGCYSRFQKNNDKETAEKLLANDGTQTLHDLKNIKRNFEELAAETKKLFENVAKFQEERSFSFKKVQRKDNKIDQEILSIKEEKFESALLELDNTMIAKRKQIDQNISRLQATSWKDKNTQIFKETCESLSKKAITVVEQFLTTYKHAENVVKTKN